MSIQLTKNQIERFSRQIVLKNIGTLGQKKIIQSKVLIIYHSFSYETVRKFLSQHV